MDDLKAKIAEIERKRDARLNVPGFEGNVREIDRVLEALRGDLKKAGG